MRSDYVVVGADISLTFRKQAQGGGPFRSSSRPMRSASANRKYVIDAGTDDDVDFEEEAGGDVSDEY